MKLPNLKYEREHDWLAERCRGKDVLHLGCAGDANLRYGAAACLHVKVARVAACLDGVEISDSALACVKQWVPPEHGRRSFYLADIHKLDSVAFGRKYDVVLAGSIIEHLENPGKMLAGIHPLLKAEGRLLVSTPNAFGLLQFMRVAVKGIERVNEQHTCWYSIVTLSQLLDRYGFRAIEWATCHGWYPDAFVWRVKIALGEAFFSLLPRLGGCLLGSFCKIVEEKSNVIR